VSDTEDANDEECPNHQHCLHCDTHQVGTFIFDMKWACVKNFLQLYLILYLDYSPLSVR
jgi:hypothetical protein